MTAALDRRTAGTRHNKIVAANGRRKDGEWTVGRGVFAWSPATDYSQSVSTTSWAYLGPAGTFTEQAALDLRARLTASAATGSATAAPDTEIDLIPAASLTAALAMVRSGEAAAACVPLENSIEGAVPLTHDELTYGEPLLIAAETYVPITFQLLAKNGMTLSNVKTVGSHPHGLAQVRDYVTTHLPHAREVVTDSTAAAAAQVAAGNIDAAAAAPVAGQRYGLEAIADNIGLTADAITRFVLVTTPGAAPPRTGNDRTSLVLWVENEPGTLLGLLTEFSARSVNLTRLESRPIRTSMGDYVFLVDADGHVTDPAMQDVLAALIRRGALLRYLGSYPRMRGTSVTPGGAAAGEKYAESTRTVANLAKGQLP